MINNPENEYLIAADGSIYPLRSLGVVVSNVSDVPVEYQTSRGYRQDGHTVDDFSMRGRTLNFSFNRVVQSRSNFWTVRTELLSTLTPDNGIVTYRRILPNGDRRDIQGWLQGGLLLETPTGLDFDASFALNCPSPFYYDPTETELELETGNEGGLVLPFFLPDELWFVSENNMTGEIDYEGTWRNYPVIEIDGPYQQITVQNTTTGGSFTLAVTIPIGTTLTIDLTPGEQTIVDGDGVNHIADLSFGNLLDWFLTIGENVILAEPSGEGATTAVRVTYQNNYIAL